MPRKSRLEQMEEAIETPSETYEMPHKKGESIPGSGGVALPWTGPKPWKEARNRSTAGSAPFSDKELKRGYRKVK